MDFYYNKGSRAYLTARYQFKKSFDIWLRYGIWVYNNRDSVLSGLNTIQGNQKSDIKILLRYLF